MVPIVAFAVTGMFLKHRDSERGGTPPAPPAENSLQVSGLTGILVGEHGARLEVRLSPLHADPERQRFDQNKLSRKFQLGSGEPWRLELRYHADPALPEAEQPRLDLEQLSIVNAAGQAFANIPSPTVAAGTLRDPLTELLSRGPTSIAAGHSSQHIVWGPVPAAGLRVSGLFRQSVESPRLGLFAPLNAESEIELEVAELRQDREVALFQSTPLLEAQRPFTEDPH